jgi:GNAT superfamily N-acetyltransferase
VIVVNNYSVKYNELSAKDFIYLWESVWDEAPSIEQVKLAMDNTLFRISIYDNDKLIAMARLIGDKGLDYYIKDVVVIPEYQRKGVGHMLIEELLKYINDNGIANTEIFVELCAMPNVIPFYEKFGFDSNEAQRLKMMYQVK